MGRYDAYKFVDCSACKYHRHSDVCETFRCMYPDNVGFNWIGNTYLRKPTEINVKRACEWFAQKESKE